MANNNKNYQKGSFRNAMEARQWNRFSMPTRFGTGTTTITTTTGGPNTTFDYGTADSIGNNPESVRPQTATLEPEQEVEVKPTKRLPKPSPVVAKTGSKTKASFKEHRYTTPGENELTRAEKGESGWHNIYGWNYKGDQETADKLRYEFEKIAADYGIPPRALSFNNKDLTIEFDPDRGSAAQHITSYASGRPPKAKFNFGSLDNLSAHLPHEMAHHLGLFLAHANQDGGTRFSEKDNNRTRIAGLGGEKENGLGGSDHFMNSESYLTIADRHYDENNVLDVDGLRKELYSDIYDNKSFQQRPELKHALATAVAYILSDQNLIAHANNSSQSWNDGHEYITDPVELWGQAFQAFSDLKRKPENERFSSNDLITPETYHAIQALMDALVVVNGNTLAKVKKKSSGIKMA